MIETKEAAYKCMKCECVHYVLEKISVDASCQEQLNTHDHYIQHIQKGIDKCFESIDSLDKKHKNTLQMYKNMSESLELLRKKTPNHLPYEKEHNPFTFQQVEMKGREDINHVKNVLYDFYLWIIDNVPNNVERSTAIGQLEGAAMWLNKSISRS